MSLLAWGTENRTQPNTRMKLTSLCDAAYFQAVRFGRVAMGKSRLEAFSDGVLAIYVAVALKWLVPDRRIERAIKGTET